MKPITSLRKFVGRGCATAAVTGLFLLPLSACEGEPEPEPENVEVPTAAEELDTAGYMRDGTRVDMDIPEEVEEEPATSTAPAKSPTPPAGGGNDEPERD